MERFLRVLVENEDFRAVFLGQLTAEDAYEVARPYLGGMSMAEFVRNLAVVADDIEAMSEGRARIPVDSMGNVSGGAGEWFSITQGILGLGLGVAGGINQIISEFRRPTYPGNQAMYQQPMQQEVQPQYDPPSITTRRASSSRMRQTRHLTHRPK